MGAIVDVQMKRLLSLLTERKIAIDLAPDARSWLADKGYDPIYGARPLKRVIQKHLQDPLAELVKIEPKSIGVGQYQHDVDQGRLGRSLDAVVEDAVNAVGVDVNTASAPLLARVSGLGKTTAEAIVAHRDETGPFASRKDLLKVPRLGARTFEQCAGFLRIPNGKEPLDASSVHPEAYGVARKIVAACGRDLRSIMGDS
eukprot:gene3278-3868_t